MANMKLLTTAALMICIFASEVNSLAEPTVWDYFDFVEIQKASPYESSREARARSFDTLGSASERSNTETYVSEPFPNRRYASPNPSGRSIGNAGASKMRPIAPIQPLRPLAREVYSEPINQLPNNRRRFTQNNYNDYNTASSSFNQLRSRPQQQRYNKPEFIPSEQYDPEQIYRPKNNRPKPQFKRQPQNNQEYQYNPYPEYEPNTPYRQQAQYRPKPQAQYRPKPQTQYKPKPQTQYKPKPQTQYKPKPQAQYRPKPQTQYRPKPQFKPEPQFAPDYVAQIEEPIYQDSINYKDSINYQDAIDYQDSINVQDAIAYQDSINYQDAIDYQDLPITYEETPIIKTKKYTFDDEPTETEDKSQFIEESLPYVNEQDLYQDEYPQYDEVLPVYQDYVQDQKESPVRVAETNKDQSQATLNALHVQDKQAQESAVIEKRQAGVHSDLDSAGQAFVADAAEVEHAKDAGRLAFQIHGQHGPHSYRFGYDTGKGENRQFRYEERDGNGEVHGRYGFYDDHGKLQIVNYSAHPKHGFKADVPHHR